MKGYILWLSIILFATAVLYFLLRTPNYVLVSFGVYTIETTVWSLILCSLLVAIAFYLVKLILLFVLKLFYLPISNIKNRFDAKVEQGVISAILGDWKKSYNFIAAFAKKNPDSFVYALMASQTAIMNKDYQATNTWLNTAIDISPNHRSVVDILRARMHWAQKHYELSLAVLHNLYIKIPSNKIVLSMLKDTLIRCKDWQSLLNILPDIKKSELMPQDEYNNLEYTVIYNIFLNPQKHDKNYSTENTILDRLTTTWKSLPKIYRVNPCNVAIYADSLIKFNLITQAQALIEDQLKKGYDKILLRIYSKLATKDILKQLQIVESFQDKFKYDYELLAYLGNVYLKNKLIGKAHYCFEKSIRLQENLLSYKKLAEIMLMENLQDEAIKYFNLAFKLAENK